jgi:hypothetical protein
LGDEKYEIKERKMENMNILMTAHWYHDSIGKELGVWKVDLKFSQSGNWVIPNVD